MGKAVIIFSHQGMERLRFPVDEHHPSVIIGREPGDGLQIDDASVSKQHGKFYWDRGAVYYLDLGSVNGSFVRGKKVESQPVPLTDGTVVSLLNAGSAITFTVSLQSSVAAAPPKAPPGRHSGQVVLIGRHPSCGIVMSQSGVSRYHAKLITDSSGVYLEDNHSTNGTFVNGVRIERPCKITENDTVHIGGVCFRLDSGSLRSADGGRGGLPVYATNIGRKVFVKGGQKTLVDDVSLRIEPNEFIAIIGGSGAGKSTFMNILCGKTPVYDGTVAYDDSGSLGNRNVYKSTIGYAPQADILYDDLTLYQMLYFSAKLKMPQDSKPDEYDRRVKQAIASVQLASHENTMVKRLSGGQRKRASIAVELLSDPRLFFLDEPTSGLDPATERHLMKMMKAMTKDNKTIVAVTHMTQNINICDKLIVLGRGGRLCFYGTPAAALHFFGVSDFVDIYEKIDENAAEWQAKYRAKALSGISPPYLAYVFLRSLNRTKKLAITPV